MLKMFGKKIKSKKGFTLIELIVVIAILAILAAILVPKFGGIQDKAKKQADITSIETIAKQIEVAFTAGDLAATTDFVSGTAQTLASTGTGSIGAKMITGGYLKASDIPTATSMQYYKGPVVVTVTLNAANTISNIKLVDSTTTTAQVIYDK